jgi:integrase
LWLQSIGPELYQKLASVGLCELSESLTLKDWLSRFLAKHNPTVSIHCQKNLNQCEAMLLEFFGEDKLVEEVTRDDAAEFRAWLEDKGYSEATVAQHVKKCKQIFTAAVEKGLIAFSPFKKVVAGSMANDQRSVYIPQEVIDRAIDFAPDAQWRLLIALNRYAGLRCPSEVLRLRWKDVDFVAGTMTIVSSKTAKQGKGVRVMPITPKLRKYLEDCFDPEQERVIWKYRESNASLRRGFLQILDKAEIAPWTRIFHNLRGSCETDLVEQFPIHVVTRWLGNSTATAVKHYLKVTPEHVRQAAGLTEKGEGAEVGLKVGHRLPETTSQTGKEVKQIPEILGDCTFPDVLEGAEVSSRGYSKQEKHGVSRQGGTWSGTRSEILRL